MGGLVGYIYSGQKRLRLGYTTGSCAALAAKAAARALLCHDHPLEESIQTPKGIVLTVPVRCVFVSCDSAAYAVTKDAGDDPDVTDGMEVIATVRLAGRAGILIDGGEGVGRVTKPGLSCPIGSAAINPVPLKMIEGAVWEVMDAAGWDGGLDVVISVPMGREIASRTFNPHLGIEGGLSILGTTGIVEPMSESALIQSIQLELAQRYAQGERRVLVTPGNYGEKYVAQSTELRGWAGVKCSNFIGEAIDHAAVLGFESLLLVGHIGKLCKVASGVMNTHSRYADCRMETLCAFAALCGADGLTLERVMESVTTDAALEALKKINLLEQTVSHMLARMQMYLTRRGGGRLQTGAVMFGADGALLGMTEGARLLLGGMN